MTKLRDNAMTLFMLAFFITLVSIASTYPAGARFMPYVVCLPAIALCVLQLALDWRRAPGAAPAGGDSREQQTLRMIGQAEAPAAGVVVEEDEPTVRREMVVWGFFLGYIAIILVFGFWIAIPLFLFSFLYSQAKFPPLKSALYAAAGTAILYLIFARGLGVILHQGFLTEMVMDRLAG